MNEAQVSAPSTRKLVIGSIVAVLAAAALLVFFVLPAEFGIDPTGSGKASGLNELSNAREMTELERGALREGVLTTTDEPLVADTFQVELLPYEAIELKYTLAEGAPMFFRWQATAPVNYDMHSHPFEGGEELTESYAVAEAPQVKGVYIAPFSGIHGWYWQNRTLEPVTLTLHATGPFTASSTFDTAGEHERTLPAPEGAEAGDKASN